MIVAVVNQTVPSGQVAVAAFVEAASANAGRDAYIAGFTPPLPVGDWLGVDTGWSAYESPGALHTWVYDFTTATIESVSATNEIQAQIKAQLLANPLDGLAVSAVASGLSITVNIEGLVVDDITTVTADPTDTKYVRVSYVYDEDTDTFDVKAYEKTTGEYAPYTPPEYLVRELGEWYVVANGTNLVAV